MNELRFLRVHVESRPTVATDQNPPSEWTDAYTYEPGRWPNFKRSEGQPLNPYGDSPYTVTVADLRVLREEALDGAPAWVLSYTFQAPSIEGPFDVFVTEWIEQSTYRLLRRERHNNDPFGIQARVTEEYIDFETASP